MSPKVWDGIIYPFPNFNGTTVEVWEWISNFIPHFIMDIIAYPCWDLKLNHVSKMASWSQETRHPIIPTFATFNVHFHHMLCNTLRKCMQHRPHYHFIQTTAKNRLAIPVYSIKAINFPMRQDDGSWQNSNNGSRWPITPFFPFRESNCVHLLHVCTQICTDYVIVL